MSQRLVLEIHHKCEVCVETIGPKDVRIRIVETNPELLNPTDFEIEGDPEHIKEALASIYLVLANIDEISRSNPS